MLIRWATVGLVAGGLAGQAGLQRPVQLAEPLVHRLGRLPQRGVVPKQLVALHGALSRVVAYSAAKSAVINLTMFLAREWATRGVRVNAISPGFFPAEQNRSLLYNPDGSYSQRAQEILRHTPMSRFGKPEELAGAVIWLASSDASSFVTGQNIIIDGGFSSSTI